MSVQVWLWGRNLQMCGILLFKAKRRHIHQCNFNSHTPITACEFEKRRSLLRMPPNQGGILGNVVILRRTSCAEYLAPWLPLRRGA